jgi:hypothetical protein
MDTVHKLFHGFETDPSVDAISEDVNASSMKSELQPGYNEKIRGGKRVANPYILLDAAFIEDLCMVAHGCKPHPASFENFNEPVERFLAVGKSTMNVQKSFEHRGLQSPGDLEHLLDFDWHV